MGIQMQPALQLNFTIAGTTTGTTAGTTASTSSAAPTLPGGPLVLAVELLIACAICALLNWLLMLRLQRRRRAGAPSRSGVLFVAFFLTTVAAGALVAADSSAASAPLFFLPIAGLFLLFFYRIPGRSTPTWTLWLIFFYGITQVGPLIPPSPHQDNPQFDHFLASIPGGTHGLLVALGGSAISIFGDIVLVTFILSGILPQIHVRYRALQKNGAPLHVSPRIPVTRGAALAAALVAGSFLLLLVSALLAQPARPIHSPVVLSARTLFFFLATLLPIVAGFALLRTRRYDRPAWIRRSLIYGTLTVCLILIYIATLGLGFFIPGLLSQLILLLIALDIPLLIALYPVLYSRIQDIIDRRFFHAEYTASHIVATYRATLPEETHLEPLSTGLTAAVQKAMQASFVTLWLRTPALAISPFGTTLPESVGAGMRRIWPDERRQELRLRWQAGALATQPAASVRTLAPDDPARTTLLQSAGAIELGRLPGASPLVDALREDGTDLVLPLLWQRELIGMLALGPRPGAQAYTFDDRELLTALADEVAPTLHVANVTHEQDTDLRQRERVEQELQTARRIQEALLPKVVPSLAGWQLATCYQPAREVGGDFYDFLTLADGRLGLVLGDVTDKGIPAALVMATTRSMLRAVAARPSISPGHALGQVNELLCQDLPASMFVTCFYAILDPATGHLRFANAGQDYPYLRHSDGSVSELRTTGMPLGLLPGSPYDEGETTLAPGDTLLFFSDGIVEAHNAQREMFGLPRLSGVLRDSANGAPPIVRLLHELGDFTGPGWEQEDDITIVALQRTDDGVSETRDVPEPSELAGGNDESSWRTLDTWTLPSVPGNERQAIARVAQVIREHALPLSTARLEQLQTAVGEATMNAMEHGNSYLPERLVELSVRASSKQLAILITDQGSHTSIPERETPDLGAKLAGLQSPRGWGLFLIRSLVDDVRVTGDDTHHTVELILTLDNTGGPPPASEAD